MTTCLLYNHRAEQRTRYYRIELAMNLFHEVSVLREWGVSGGSGQSVINIYGNLREASEAADVHRNRMLQRGYLRDAPTH
ncbi:WGR domain-containing protein [Epibacterium sp. SM1969]|uniref:WGR domain-containing protein n=1 Tax=Tritonibacter aquimaris TaxID=2663379 RepID=A0A844AX20_9RHOB|nr:WGR domain-containing protein [Tritonibacter aquimaris]MQY41726.1 WGR domain-containing protein [Tritonibacter aquimaris]